MRPRLLDLYCGVGGAAMGLLPRRLRRCSCERSTLPVLDVTGGGDTAKPRTDGGGGRPRKGTADQARAIMGIPWATKEELNEAIPPDYTRPIAWRLRREL